MSDETLLDRDHLDAQTFGDEALARELLGLFADQCRSLLPGVADPGRSEADRADLAHTLKGSALGVGASRVAARAAETEDALRVGSDVSPGRALALAEAVAATLAALDATS
ncbi:Hpt domain-containing protein [Methylobacterium brachythecii]|uniref:HPt (Histidine-containing phosphotransfer) domain-containing protein n=1 Tax=Methylobacterium brachythecii TaxID=1176177 RepID=A0A7W6F8Y0_9HYPH|nr:Hpt domain-containing protein [Methylobacterium brachythecii]MBB3904895.1 HPt (histidine-containing phosphotransfer) domain-containing protein [Methylobacterium brachythecii]GLS46887.1 hypothetical protein GCM10007884_48850 [Methylobacterium brachythecii]